MGTKIYTAGGTLGDAYIIYCKVYGDTIENNVKILHYVGVKNWVDGVREIYSLSKNIEVSFISVDEFYNLGHEKLNGNFVEDNHQVTWFPKLPKMDVSKFGLPNKYIVVNPKSGRIEQRREIPETYLNSIISDSIMPVVLIGSNYNNPPDGCINLIGKTSILEAYTLIVNSESFIGFQGMMAWVALSQKKMTQIYCSSVDDMHAVRVRSEGTPWENYINRIVRV